MLYKKLSAISLILLILNLNMVIPAVSYATAEETCTCHFNSSDRQCHCDEGCKSCGMHKEQGSGVRGKGSENPQPSAIKGMTCSTSPQSDSMVLPILAIPFMVPAFSDAIPPVQVSTLSRPLENPLYGVTVTPSEKPPTV
jgi:hypothetical protein